MWRCWKTPKNALINPHTNGALISAKDRLCSSSTAAPPITGAESKKETRALAARERPSSKAAVMVMPLLDTPGIMASACAQPINKTVFKPSSVEVWSPALRSAAHKITANTIKQTAIINGFLKVVSAQSPNKTPANPAGTVPKARYQMVLPCGVRGRVSPSFISWYQSFPK